MSGANVREAVQLTIPGIPVIEPKVVTATQLPQPSGYQILAVVPAISEKTEGGLIKANITKQHEELLTVVLFVVAMGPDCYKDEKRFPSGAYCKIGDFILCRPHTGSRINIHGQDMRLLNDDCVLGTVSDPRGYRRS